MAAVLNAILGRIPGLLAVIITDKDGVVVVQCESSSLLAISLCPW
jgi:hypothetical protein